MGGLAALGWAGLDVGMTAMTWGRSLVATVMLSGLATAGRAQQLLCVEHKGKAAVVRAVHDGNAQIEVDGKRITMTRGVKSALVDAKEFLPFFVSVRHMEAKSTYLTLHGANGGSGDINNQFEFHATFESPFHLKDVFFVLEIHLEAGKYIFYYEVGELEPRVPRPVRVYVPVSFKLGEGRFQLHLFSEGGELLHSEQPPLFRDQVLDRMVRRRLEGVSDAPLRPFIGPAPEYPRAFYKKKLQGEAVVRFRVTRTGAVLSAEVASATAPEFGEAALAAVRLWRFLPPVKGGVAVEGKAELPFKFTPPAEEK